MKLLIVENEADITRLVSFVLSGQGFTVDTASDSVTAERRMKECNYDAILLDVMLPGEDGYSFCRRLKLMGHTRDIPVIILSARVMPDEVRKGLECGATGYITKPYEPMTLGKEIMRICGWSRGEPGEAGG